MMGSLTTRLVVEQLQGNEIHNNRFQLFDRDLQVVTDRVKASGSCPFCGDLIGVARSYKGENLAEAIVTWLNLETNEV
ncbi:hypothetical protein ANRL3_00531 [Anaerolineae bacterium]|nr:hypothetical protein ANRL3_00531 [Anaerolineae bacterium]